MLDEFDACIMDRWRRMTKADCTRTDRIKRDATWLCLEFLCKASLPAKASAGHRAGSEEREIKLERAWMLLLPELQKCECGPAFSPWNGVFSKVCTIWGVRRRKRHSPRHLHRPWIYCLNYWKGRRW